MKKPTYYITTPLYYPSGKWHLGHSYTTVCCDAIARYKRMSGFDVFYLTGTDEHGQKIAERAAVAGITPKQFVDGLVAEIKELWQLLDISYDGFIRTTDDYHIHSVQQIFKKLYDSGDIYKGKYKGKYCTPCEAFFSDSQLKDGKCPDCGREVKDSEEECYFFRLSKYEKRVHELLKTDFLQPQSRANEMINNFIKPGLADLAVSRTSVKWGIPVSFDDKHVVYVWIDALSNYINALGYNNNSEFPSALGYNPDENGDKTNMRYWPADVHMVGKEIVRFHTIIWPAILMALGLDVPKRVYGHGWLLLGGDKMSKSKGNVADPFLLAQRYGIDALRYYLLREVPFGQDGVYTDESFLMRINSDLVNDLGNLVKRTVAMANQYFGGVISKPIPDSDDNNFIERQNNLKEKTDGAMGGFSCSKALDEIFALISGANKYIDENAPWILFKEGKTDRLNAVLYNLLECIRIAATLLCPFITKGTARIFDMLKLPLPTDFSLAAYGKTEGYTTGTDEVLYLRLDIKKELEALQGDTVEGDKNKKEAKESKNNKDLGKDKNNKMTEQSNNNEKAKPLDLAAITATNTESGLITIDEFFKTELKVAEVIAAEKVEKADKLLKLSVRVGEEVRTVVSGIAKSYTPDEMVGKKVVLVSNLKPAKIRGIESFGMLLCASFEDKIVLISPETDTPSGSIVG